MQYHGATYAEDVWDIYWYEHNLQGDIVGIYDQTGTKLVSYTYDAWGLRTTTLHNNATWSVVTKNPHGYRGYYYDNDIAFYYLGTRYYDQNTHRFLSPDSIEYLDPQSVNGSNLYSYCGNNPVNCFDPSGHSAITLMTSLIGGTNSAGSSNSDTIKQPKANAVEMAHHTVPLIKNPIVSWMLGNISYTTTVQLNSAETFYSFSNIGNDEYSVGLGVNLENWYGASAYVSSDIGFGSSWQLTPWITGSYGWSLKNGISNSGGIIIGDTTHEITVSVGNGALLGYALCAGLAVVPVPGARAVAAGAASIIFIVDLFN